MPRPAQERVGRRRPSGWVGSSYAGSSSGLLLSGAGGQSDPSERTECSGRRPARSRLAAGSGSIPSHAIEDIAWQWAIDSVIIVVGRSDRDRRRAALGRGGLRPGLHRISRMGVPAIYEDDHGCVPKEGPAWHRVRRNCDSCVRQQAPVWAATVRCSIRRATKSRSRRCHRVWHGPRSNWVEGDLTGVHFTLTLADSAMTSVGWAWFKSPLAHRIRTASHLVRR